MHIQNVNINLRVPGFGAALLSALMQFDAPSAATPVPAVPAVPAASTPPQIGEAWPGIDGVYVGLSRGEDGEPDAHLVLLNATPAGALSWDAAVEWAKGLGEGARLPSRFESALLYANVQDKLDAAHWHWTGTQYSSNHAWYQNFTSGGQGSSGEDAEGRCRAVRRLSL